MMDGEIVFAQMNKAKGAEAFKQMVVQNEGSFEVDFDAQPPDTNVALSTMQLLLATISTASQ